MNVATRLLYVSLILFLLSCQEAPQDNPPRQRLSLNEGWKFKKYKADEEADDLIYDVRPEIKDTDDTKEADTEPTDAVELQSSNTVLKPYILPTANKFIKDKSKHHIRPSGNPGEDFPFMQANYDDSSWEEVTLPHDWAIEGPFLEGWNAEVGGGMGRLPSHGVAWYRNTFNLSDEDKDKSIFLDVDGAMSYAMVWLSGQLVGGWPFGYNSWRLDLTPYLTASGDNQLAIRIDNPNHSSRWYPGGGIYRNIWLTKTHKVHIAHWGTTVTTPAVSQEQASINIEVNIDNDDDQDQEVSIFSEIYAIDAKGDIFGTKVASTLSSDLRIGADSSLATLATAKINNPRLWGPPPSQTPHMYRVITYVKSGDMIIDEYHTDFGIRSIDFRPDGLMVNGEEIELQGVNLHHDLGALGAAFNVRAAERQLEILHDLGANAIRLAHNPPAPEFLALTDRMGFLVIDESFDCWERKKTPHDFHLIFDDWHEADLRAMVRRDKNHPSVIAWSYGNEVGEQYTDDAGADLSRYLSEIVKDEDPTRLTTASMNFAKPPMPFPGSMDVMSLNYQGEGIRNAPGYSHLKGINTAPLYPSFQKTYPDKAIISSETAAALSSRGVYLFPVAKEISSPIADPIGGDEKSGHVSSYELYTANFGSSADKVFKSQDQHPFVLGEFVWSGFDYLGEPTPYYLNRSSYFGIIDLAGFPKDRYYLYQSRWRPDHPSIHILPHWDWPERVGQVTPVHIFTSGDEVELFLNGRSLGRKSKREYEYRLRWDDVIYTPGELKAIAYKSGQKWAETTVKTTGSPAQLSVSADRDEILADAKDLSFVTVKLLDKEANFIRNANNQLRFSIEGPGEIVATDNGDPTDMTEFPSHVRKAFSGMALCIVRAKKGETGPIKLTVSSDDIESNTVTIQAK